MTLTLAQRYKEKLFPKFFVIPDAMRDPGLHMGDIKHTVKKPYREVTIELLNSHLRYSYNNAF
jgi:hypothetical protein